MPAELDAANALEGLDIDAAGIFAGLIILAILIGSAALWIRRASAPTPPPPLPNQCAPAWSIGWINFGIFICAMVVIVALFQYGGAMLFSHFSDAPASIDLETSAAEVAIEGAELDRTAPDDASDALATPEPPAKIKLTPQLAVIAVLLLQAPLLITFFGARTFWPKFYGGSLNAVPLSIVQAFKTAATLFILYLPIIWGASIAWNGVLTLLQKFDLLDEFPPQELITLFSQGGSPIAIGLLAGCAVILAPLVEEIIFRGCIYRFFKSEMPLSVAQILSGALFAVIHGNLMSLAPLLVIGILLARIYEKSGNILVPICFHACFNAFSLLMLLIMSNSTLMPASPAATQDEMPPAANSQKLTNNTLKQPTSHTQ